MYRWFPNLAKASQASGTRACWRGFKRGLPPMPSTSDLLRVYGLKAKQQLSQNFILDLRVTDRLVAALGDVSDCAVIEVGPGKPARRLPKHSMNLTRLGRPRLAHPLHHRRKPSGNRRGGEGHSIPARFRSIRRARAVRCAADRFFS